MVEYRIDVIFSPRGVDHHEASDAERTRIIVHEDTVISVISMSMSFYFSTIKWTDKSFALLKAADDDTISVLVCHLLRDLTRSNMSVLMVG